MRNLIAAVERVDPLVVSGRVAAVNGLLIEARGGLTRLAIGARTEVDRRGAPPLEAEVVGFRETRALLMPFGALEGVAPGAEIRIRPEGAAVRPTMGWLGRVVDAFGQPIDGKGTLEVDARVPLTAEPPNPLERELIGEPLETGVRAIDSMLTIGRGQRLGIFAGSGVGKSTLLGMIARRAEADVNVIALLGERGREVRDFIENRLGPEGLKRSVVVVATGDQAALVRARGALVATAIAEYFRDQGKQVLLMVDSVTRVAMAWREIGLAAGEPPTTKGYPPSVFASLPRLLERAGNGKIGGITGIYTVLVDGDDFNEPIADAARSILDGHIVLERAIAERGRYPAINVLKSISRTMPGCQTPLERETVTRARASLAAYANMEELIRIGAYRAGSDVEVDRAIALNPGLEGFLAQDKDDYTSLPDAFDRLDGVLERDRG